MSATDRWGSGTAYEAYVGRWSRLVAHAVVDRLAIPPGRRWLDVGCGTGALTRAILDGASPGSIVGVDPSAPFLEHARATITDPRVRFDLGTADATGVADASVDVVVSGLVLNFVPDATAALREQHRVVVPGGTVEAHVWDYGSGMQFMCRFWDAAVDVDTDAAQHAEANRFPLANPDPLMAAFRAAGFADVSVEAVDIPTTFADFDDLWTPFLGATGPAPAYLASVSTEVREAVRERLFERVRGETATDGSVRLTARAWMARGTRAG